jgi:hypothetical protein
VGNAGVKSGMCPSMIFVQLHTQRIILGILKHTYLNVICVVSTSDGEGREKANWNFRAALGAARRCLFGLSRVTPSLKARSSPSLLFLFLTLICSSLKPHSFSLSCPSRPFSACSPSKLLAARGSRVKYILISNTVTRTWVAVRLFDTLVTLFISVDDFDSRIGPVRWRTLYWVNSCAQTHNKRCSVDRPQNRGELPRSGNWHQEGWY